MPAKKKSSRKKAKAKVTAKKKKAVKKTSAPAKKKTVWKSSGTKSAARKKAVKKSSPVKKKTAAKKSTTSNKSKKTAKTNMSKVTNIKKKSKASSRQGAAKESIKPYVIKSGEEYMGPEQTEHFREILLNWKRELMEEVDRTVHHMRDEASNFPDPNDRATQEEEFALELRTRDRERKLIKKIDESLIALDNKEYGYCEMCGVEIGIRRLEARPTATLCIDCKTLDEIKERHLA